jgi:DNA-directed RNA polymerase subunit H (RpoH/RPB5)
MYSLHVADPSLDGGNETMNVFNVDKSQLPDVQEQDIIIMKDSYVDDFNKRRSNSGHNGTAYALFRGDQAPEQVESQAKKCALNDIDLEIVNYLFEWNKERKTQQDDAPTVSRARQLIETCRLGDNGVKWLNYIGMIVKYTPTTEKFQKGSKAVLVLTDYTVNPSPSATSDLGINYAKFYPLNNEHMLVCTLWDNHADDCPDLEQGDYVYLDNCKRKFNSMGCLELNINGKDGDKNKVRKVTENDPIVQKLLERQGHQQQKKRKREQYESCFIRTRM